MREYLPRIYDALLEKRVGAKGVVLVEGAKWCGKTTTCERLAKSVVYMQDPRTKSQNVRLAEIAPLELLQGETPRLIDVVLTATGDYSYYREDGVLVVPLSTLGV